MKVIRKFYTSWYCQHEHAQYLGWGWRFWNQSLTNTSICDCTSKELCKLSHTVLVNLHRIVPNPSARLQRAHSIVWHFFQIHQQIPLCFKSWWANLSISSCCFKYGWTQSDLNMVKCHSSNPARFPDTGRVARVKLTLELSMQRERGENFQPRNYINKIKEVLNKFFSIPLEVSFTYWQCKHQPQ